MHPCAHPQDLHFEQSRFNESFPVDDAGAIRRRISSIIHVVGPTFHREPNGQDADAPLQEEEEL